MKKSFCTPSALLHPLLSYTQHCTLSNCAIQAVHRLHLHLPLYSRILSNVTNHLTLVDLFSKFTDIIAAAIVTVETVTKNNSHELSQFGESIQSAEQLVKETMTELKENWRIK